MKSLLRLAFAVFVFGFHFATMFTLPVPGWSPGFGLFVQVFRLVLVGGLAASLHFLTWNGIIAPAASCRRISYWEACVCLLGLCALLSLAR